MVQKSAATVIICSLLTILHLFSSSFTGSLFLNIINRKWCFSSQWFGTPLYQRPFTITPLPMPSIQLQLLWLLLTSNLTPWVPQLSVVLNLVSGTHYHYTFISSQCFAFLLLSFNTVIVVCVVSWPRVFSKAQTNEMYYYFHVTFFFCRFALFSVKAFQFVQLTNCSI